MFCSSCGAKNSAEGRFCSSCGAGLDHDAEATILGNDPVSQGVKLDPAKPEITLPPLKTPAARTPAPRTPAPLGKRRAPSGPTAALLSSDPIGGGRFVPGQIVAERYRIVALAGRGGMGEVYRAEDLKLSQIVAIKFLPESVSKDAGVLARFHSEVRIARQVSHPNVCRMFDIGDADGVIFLTMEYVDGEDLSSLIRRIGRLSTDKATEIARQTCAGLAAAHDRGVIHRDLKPANLMLDSAGRIRITDFGLAGIAATIQGAEVRAGTPAYMAPEQLAGREVTIKSDLYALGLVMYEILTGKRAFEASTLPELMRLREESAPISPSSIVRDLDPPLERVVLRCLEKDPALRPSSALQVAAALPGGDPLAAALAAGETPSPQMVAAAGETSGLAPRIAVSALFALLLGTIFFVYMGVKESGLERLDPSKSPEVLASKASEILARLGYPDRPVDKAFGFAEDTDLLSYVKQNDKPRPDWSQVLTLRPMLLNFWYRQSPRELVAEGVWGGGLTPGVVTFDDPAPTLSGMITMWLDADGRLQWLQALPPQLEPSESAAQQPAHGADWSALFAAAEIDPTQLHSVAPTWNSLAAADERKAWDGVWPGSGRPVHVEAAAWHGKPVYFNLVGPWTKPERMPNRRVQSANVKIEDDRKGRIEGISFLTLVIILVLGGIWFAVRNIIRGRGDRKGAWRLAWVVFGIEVATFLFRAHFVPTTETLLPVVMAVSTALFAAGIMWVLYMALEPYVRRAWPQTIISWTRLVDGRVRDPLVGRDLVFGVLIGMSWILVYELGTWFEIHTGAPFTIPVSEFLLGTREALAMCFSIAVNSIMGTLMFFLTLVLLRVLVRNRWLAAVLFVLIYSLPKIVTSDHVFAATLVWVPIEAIAAIAVVRFGLIALGVACFMANLLLNVPYTLDFSNWYAAHCVFIVLLFVALGVWGFYLSLAGKQLWKDELLE
jgi:serine/threonine protein kinase